MLARERLAHNDGKGPQIEPGVTRAACHNLPIRLPAYVQLDSLRTGLRSSLSLAALEVRCRMSRHRWVSLTTDSAGAIREVFPSVASARRNFSDLNVLTRSGRVTFMNEALCASHRNQVNGQPGIDVEDLTRLEFRLRQSLNLPRLRYANPHRGALCNSRDLSRAARRT